MPHSSGTVVIRVAGHSDQIVCLWWSPFVVRFTGCQVFAKQHTGKMAGKLALGLRVMGVAHRMTIDLQVM